MTTDIRKLRDTMVAAFRTYNDHSQRSMRTLAWDNYVECRERYLRAEAGRRGHTYRPLAATLIEVVQ